MSTVANAPLVIDNIRPGGLVPGQLPSARPQGGGSDDMSFWDFLDVINPLQHLPIISTIYREMTGDTIKPALRVAGGALLGGPLGAGLAVVTEIAEEAAGLNDGQTLLALFSGEDAPKTAAPQTAQAQGPSAADRIAQYASAPADEGVPAGLPASAAPVMLADAGTAAAAAPQAAPAAASTAATTTAGTDARFYPVAQTAAAKTGFKSIRPTDIRPADALPRMPAPEKRPAGLSAQTYSTRAVAMNPVTRPASAALLTEAPAPQAAAQVSEAPADYIRVPSKTEMAVAARTAETAPAVSAQTAENAVLRALEAQGLQGEANRHPMLRGTPESGRPATDSVAAAAPTDGSAPQEVPGWFDQAMLKALDRYQQMGSLTTDRPATTETGA